MVNILFILYFGAQVTPYYYLHFLNTKNKCEQFHQNYPHLNYS